MFSRCAARSLPITRSTRSALKSKFRTGYASAPARTFFTIVEQGYEGWRLMLGSEPVKLEPGLRLAIPFLHTVYRMNMREQSVDIRELSAFTSDNVPVVISGSLFFRVRDSYHACFSVDNFERNVANIGTSAMRSVIGHFNYDEVIGDRNKINSKLQDVIGTSIQSWGVDCTRFEVQNFKPHNRDVEKQLELQMAAERDRRKQILDTQALINVAEGHKQRTILESEGALQSQLNESAGHRRKLILESEGMLEAAKNQGEALAQQVDIVARALAAPSTSPSPIERSKALEALLELRRLEQLNAIARGHGNSTYFFGEAKPGTGRDAYEVDNVEKWKRAMLQSELKSAFAASSAVPASADAV